MSGEPKTLTPGELLAIAHEHDWSAHFHDDGYVEIESLGGDDLAYEGGLLDALCAATSKVLGVPVVARDEAAELREENKRLRASVDDLLLAPNPLDDENMRLRAEAAELRAAARRYLARLDECEENQYPRGSIAHLEKDKALEALRRLAGGENEK